MANGLPIPVSLPTEYNPGRYNQDGSASLINAYAENTGTEAKARWVNYAVSGLDVWNSVTNSGTVTGITGVRAMLVTDSYLYVVAGRDVTAIDTLGVKTLITTLAADGAAYFARNRRSPTPEVCLVADGTGYIITGTSIATITDADLPPPTSVSVKDGYFLFPTTFDRIFISDEDNGSSIQPLMFGKAQAQPDNTLYWLGSERDSIVFGTNSVEWFSDSPDGTGGFPFVRVAAIDQGCAGAKTVIQLDRAVAMIASDGTVRIQEGYSFKRISNYAVERLIASVDASTILGFGWNEPATGHAFMAWTCDSFTVVYDLRTGKWHLRKSKGLNCWRGSCSVQWQGMTLIGDRTDGRIYKIAPDVMTEGGDPITMELILPIIHQAPYGLALDAIYVDMATGVGAGTLDEDRNPKIMISTSADGGVTFAAERLVEIGAGGQTQTTVKRFRFGDFGPQGVTIRLAVSASVKRAIMGASIVARKLLP